jgi:hypothetical protein
MNENIIPYDRKVLVEVLIYHQRKNVRYCECGWGELGKSHAEHVADIYEMSIKERVKCPTP